MWSRRWSGGLNQSKKAEESGHPKASEYFIYNSLISMFVHQWEIENIKKP